MNAQPNGLRENDMGAHFGSARGLKILKYLQKYCGLMAPPTLEFSAAEVSATSSPIVCWKGPAG
jgi:hypothetical protein